MYKEALKRKKGKRIRVRRRSGGRKDSESMGSRVRSKESTIWFGETGVPLLAGR
jgi:hypothetical protein